MKNSFPSLSYSFLPVLLVSMGAQANASLPADWVVRNDPATDSPLKADAEEPIDPDDGVDPDAIASVESILSAQSRAMEAIPETAPKGGTALVAHPRPGDWTAWRLASLATDLSVSSSGWVGSLVNKGTPSVTFYWRKQGPRPSASFIESDSTGTVSVTSDATPEDLVRELEPSVRAALATGRIRDESRLRENLLAAASEFRDAASRLEGIGQGEWWASRLRADLSVDASGKLGPAASIGGEVKLRLEWHRLMRKTADAPKLPLKAPSTVFGTSRFGEGLVDLASGLAEDLDAMTDPRIEKRGFKAYVYRVGVGVSEKGNVGIAQATTTLYAHLYFSRTVAKPVIRPLALSPLRSPAGVRLVGASGDEGGVTIERGKFRKGLRKTLRIGRFFAKRAQKARVGKWKVYELRTGFEISLSGKTGTAKVNGLGATEIGFYNQNF